MLTHCISVNERSAQWAFRSSCWINSSLCYVVRNHHILASHYCFTAIGLMKDLTLYSIRSWLVPLKYQNFSKLVRVNRQQWSFIFQNLKNVTTFCQKRNWRVVKLLRHCNIKAITKRSSFAVSNQPKCIEISIVLSMHF